MKAISRLGHFACLREFVVLFDDDDDVTTALWNGFSGCLSHLFSKCDDKVDWFLCCLIGFGLTLRLFRISNLFLFLVELVLVLQVEVGGWGTLRLYHISSPEIAPPYQPLISFRWGTYETQTHPSQNTFPWYVRKKRPSLELIKEDVWGVQNNQHPLF